MQIAFGASRRITHTKTGTLTPAVSTLSLLPVVNNRNSFTYTLSFIQAKSENWLSNKRLRAFQTRKNSRQPVLFCVNNKFKIPWRSFPFADHRICYQVDRSVQMALQWYSRRIGDAYGIECSREFRFLFQNSRHWSSIDLSWCPILVQTYVASNIYMVVSADGRDERVTQNAREVAQGVVHLAMATSRANKLLKTWR